MKRTVLLLMSVALVLISMQSCEKEDPLQPRFPDHVFFPQGKIQIVDNFYPYADRERSLAQPESYDAITDSAYSDFKEIWEKNILNELDILTGKVNKEFREGSDRHDVKDAYNEIDAGFHPEFYNFCPDVLEDLHLLISNYVLNVVDGNPEWTDGTANEWHRNEILNFLDKKIPNNSWSMTYGDMIRTKMKDYVVTGQEPDNVRNGWLFFHN